MNSGFVHISGLGIYREDTIKKVVPYAETDYRIVVDPPFGPDAEFEFLLTKKTEVFAAMYIEGEDEPVIDEDSKVPVTSQVSLTLEEALLGLFGTDDEDVKDKIRKKVKNYKIRVRKIAEHEAKMLGLEAAKGSANYDTLIKAVEDTAPTNEGQAERVSDVSELLNTKLQEIVTENADTDNDHPFLEQLNEHNGDQAIKDTAKFVIDDFYNIKILKHSFKDESFDEAESKLYEDGKNFDDLVSDRLSRLEETPPESAVENAFGILASGTALQNKVEDTDEDETEETLFEGEDEKEDEEEEMDEVKP